VAVRAQGSAGEAQHPVAAVVMVVVIVVFWRAMGVVAKEGNA
jgi:hypothetical protein